MFSGLRGALGLAIVLAGVPVAHAADLKPSLIWDVTWHAPAPPPPPPHVQTSLERLFEPQLTVMDAVVHYYCTLSVKDPKDGFEACLASTGPMGLVANDGSAASAIAAEARTAPGGCIIGVRAHSDRSIICAIWKEAQ